MSRLFNSILIPVDFSVNTEVVVKQSIELANVNGSIIHLVHVMKPRNMWNNLVRAARLEAFRKDTYSSENVIVKLQQWGRSIEETLPNSKVNTYVREGSVGSEIIVLAKEVKPALVIICKDKNHEYFSLLRQINGNSLAKSTGYPVLTVQRKSINTKIKIIVVPIRSFIPMRKIELAMELAKKYRAAIHLVTVFNENDFTETKRNSFLESYRILKSGLSTPIEHHILKGKNFPKTVLEYAGCIRADLMLVNPGSETRMSGITGKHIHDAVSTSSKLNILSIEPYPVDKVSINETSGEAFSLIPHAQ